MGRALSVLAGQLDEAADLARLVKRDQAPQIISATVQTDNTIQTDKTTSTQILVQLVGSNLRRHASAVLIAENREDLADIHARSLAVTPPGSATATFRDPMSVRNSIGVTWLLAFTNEDGSQSYPIALTR